MIVSLIEDVFRIDHRSLRLAERGFRSSGIRQRPKALTGMVPAGAGGSTVAGRQVVDMRVESSADMVDVRPQGGLGAQPLTPVTGRRRP